MKFFKKPNTNKTKEMKSYVSEYNFIFGPLPALNVSMFQKNKSYNEPNWYDISKVV
jgi:hypothetical protein